MKKLIAPFILFGILFSVINIYAQPYVIWNKLYNGGVNYQDSAVGLAANSLGNVYLTGWSLNPGNASDIVTIKYNIENGDTLWVRKFSTAFEDKPSSITCDNNFVYITGWSFSSNTRDIITIKYNALTGDTVFVKRYNGTGNGGDYGRALAIDVSGNVYVTGRSDIGSAQKYTTIKYDPSGNQLWVAVYTGTLSTIFDESLAIKLDAAGNAYVTGYCNGASASTSDILTLKLNNSDGSIAWAKRFNGSLNAEDRGTGIVLDNSGNNVIVGGYASRPTTVQDFFAIKYSTSTGDSVASIYYSGSNNIEFAYAMTKDETDNIYLTGFAFFTGNNHFQTVRFNAALTTVDWFKQVMDNDSSVAGSIAYDSGSVYVTGNSSSAGSGKDYMTIKYNATNGGENWRRKESGAGTGNDYGGAIVTKGGNYIIVTGSLNSGGTTVTNMFTVRYSDLNAVKPISTIVPGSYNLEQNYPNPFNPVTNIRFDIPKSSFVNVTVYDILGKEIAQLVNENLKAGTYEADWNASGVSSGIYFYRITAGDFTATKKMILNK